MRRTDQTNTDERRQQIVDAAVASFNERGLHGASIGQICKEAGLSPGHLYYYFENKDALIQAVFANDWEIGKRYLDALVDTPNALAIYLGLASAKGVATAAEQLNLAFVLDVLAEVSRNPAIAKVNKAHRKQYLGRIRQLVEAAQARGELAAGASIEVVMQALDILATARSVARAALRHDAEAYAVCARQMLKSLVRLPE